DIEPLAGAGQAAQGGALVLAEVVLDRGDVQAALRIEDILAPGLVEPHGDIVARAAQGRLAQAGEAPRSPEARAARAGQGVVVDAARQGHFVPPAGVQVDLVPVGDEAARQVGDVGAAAAAGREDLVVAERDIHVTPLYRASSHCAAGSA